MGHYEDLATAYLLSKHPEHGSIDSALEAGVRLHQFKDTGVLPRVKKVLGTLKGFSPTSLLDVGSGRGAFLWPLIQDFNMPVVSIDLLSRPLHDIKHLNRGGISSLNGCMMSATHMGFKNKAFDGATALEVLEHMERPDLAAKELVRVSRRFVVASVPSKEDDNPEHIQLFTEKSLSDLFLSAGAMATNVTYVLNHIIMVATINH